MQLLTTLWVWSQNLEAGPVSAAHSLPPGVTWGRFPRERPGRLCSLTSVQGQHSPHPLSEAPGVQCVFEFRIFRSLERR